MITQYYFFTCLYNVKTILHKVFWAVFLSIEFIIVDVDSDTATGHQAITWSNVDQFHRCILKLLGHSELKLHFC